MRRVEDASCVTANLRPDGCFEICDDGEAWQHALTVMFNRANDAYFTAWEVEARCGYYNGRSGFMVYDVKSVIA